MNNIKGENTIYFAATEILFGGDSVAAIALD